MSRRDLPPAKVLENMIVELEGAGLHRARIARESGLDKSTVTRMARGEAQKPGFETYTKLADLHARVLLPRR